MRDTAISCGLRVNEYMAKDSGYKAIDISAHDINFATFRTSDFTIDTADGHKVDVKTLEYIGHDGVKHEITLFGKRY